MVRREKRSPALAKSGDFAIPTIAAILETEERRHRRLDSREIALSLANTGAVKTRTSVFLSNHFRSSSPSLSQVKSYDKSDPIGEASERADRP